MTKIYLIIGFFLVAPSIGRNTSRNFESSDINFFKEEITINIKDSTAEISGVYYFRNESESNSSLRIFFPFAVDENSEFPYAIDLVVLKAGKMEKISYLNAHNAVRFTIPLEFNAVTAWRLDYSQKIKSNHVRYILTTTQTWGKPIADADYKIIIPEYFTGVSMWPEPDSITEWNGKRIYRSHRGNFMPERDLEINWE